MLKRRTMLKAAIANGAFLFLPPVARAAHERPQVSAAIGRMRGVYDRGVRAFLGIPYGASTQGEGRHRAPRPARPWRGVLDAGRFGTIAPQAMGGVPPDFQAVLNYRELAMPGEDCLRLNVWTPDAEDHRNRPVMVWFHGGGFSTGSGGIPLYDGVNLARRGNVVVVTVNHRLASFGYLDLSWTGDPRFAGSGNAGNLDLCLALRWIRENIEAFGGDPGNVTIFGQSGGGAKVATVMAMPAAQGLFHKAIIQSGAKLRVRTPDASERDARAFLAALKLTPREIDKLASMPLAHLYEASRVVTKGALSGWGPVLDEDTLPHHPFDPEAASAIKDVPLIIGWTAEETALFDAFLFRDPAFGALNLAMLNSRATELWGEHGARMLAAYRQDYPDLGNWGLWMRIKADAFAGANSIRLAERKARQPAPVFAYRLDWRSPADGGRLGAFHGLDQPLVFDNLALSPGWAGTGEDAQALADRMSSAWIAFAHDGHPQAAGLPAWPAYTPDHRATMLFDTHCRVENDPAPHVRQAWRDIPPSETL